MRPATGVVDVDADPIAYRRAGSGPDVILFLHGLGASRTSWDAQLAAFATSHLCIAWDAPGYGASRHTAGLGFADYAQRAAGLLDSLAVARATVVGLSFGGQIALHLAARHPARVGRLVLADTSAVFGADGTDPDRWRRQRLEPLDRGISPVDMAPSVLRSVGGPALAGTVLDEAIASMGRATGPGLRTAVECLPTHDVRDDLPSITAPTLIIVGQLDTETPLSYAEELDAAIPNSQLHVIPDAGHLTPMERPDEFNRVMGEFLAATNP